MPIRFGSIDDRHVLLYIDRHILNEYTSPQAFAGLREAVAGSGAPKAPGQWSITSIRPRRSGSASSPTGDAARQVDYFEEQLPDFGIELFGILDARQGIEHVVVPEQGMALPGMVIACGDSHTTTHGALGALGFGIGTSDVEHVLATQTIVYERLRNMRVSGRGPSAARSHARRTS